MRLFLNMLIFTHNLGNWLIILVHQWRMLAVLQFYINSVAQHSKDQGKQNTK